MADVTTPAHVQNRRTPRTWAVVLAACVGQFLVVLDVSVVNVALPSMRSDLGLSAAQLQWVLNAYAIAFAGFMLLGGRAADLYGRKRMFLVGLGLFTAASLVEADSRRRAGSCWPPARRRGSAPPCCPPRPSPFSPPPSPKATPGPRRSAPGWPSARAAARPHGMVGGVLTDVLNWRWVLLINVPFGVLVLIGGAAWLAESRARERHRIDLLGAVLVTAGLAAVAYGIVQTEQEGWAAPATLVPLLGGLALLALFVLVEARTAAPLMPLRVLGTRAVAAANVAMIVMGSATFSMWYFMTVYAQSVLGYTPMQAGFALLPTSLAVVLGSTFAPRMMARVGAKNLVLIGLAVTAAGFGWQSTMGADGSYFTSICGPGVLMMAGAGFASTPLASLATSGAAPGDAGLVSGLVNTSRTMGGALGLAVLSTVAAARTGGGTGAEDLTAGFALAFRTAGSVLLGGLLMMTLWLPRHRSPRSGTPSVSGASSPSRTSSPSGTSSASDMSRTSGD